MRQEIINPQKPAIKRGHSQTLIKSNNMRYNEDSEAQLMQEAQEWELIKEEVARLVALDDPRQLHPQFIQIEDKTVFDELVKTLAYAGKRGRNPSPKTGEWVEIVVTFAGTYYEYTPNQINKPTKQAY